MLVFKGNKDVTVGTYVRPFHATMGAVAFLQGPMGNANGQQLRLKKEMGIFTDLCSYFDKKQEPRASSDDTDLSVISHNYLQRTACAALASFTKG
jgi:hypothetical protein